jgi:hypothetical protein
MGGCGIVRSDYSPDAEQCARVVAANRNGNNFSISMTSSRPIMRSFRHGTGMMRHAT